MNWYRPKPDADEYDGLLCTDPQDAIFFSRFMRDYYRYGRNTEWREIAVVIDPMEQPSDFPSFIAQHLVLSEQAWRFLFPLIASDVELLPLTSAQGQFKAIKISDTTDYLDYSKSVYEESTSGFIQVEEYAFQEERITEKHIFWLPKAYHTVVSQNFKELVEQTQLKGLIFDFLC